MATKVTTLDSNKAEKVNVEFNNGDLEALRDIKKKWHFKDLESVLRFGLAVLTIAEKGKLFHEKTNGKMERLDPMDDLVEVR
jgi:hypothetical protein